MRNIFTYIMVLATLVMTGCDKQRDLYVTAGPLIRAEGNWEPSLGKTDMTMDATAVAYDAAGLAVKEYFFAPHSVTFPVNAGTYDIMLFNGLMYAADNTHLDDIYFRGTDYIDTFEAVAREGTLIQRLARAGGGDEYIASNNMEIVTSAVEKRQVDASHSYYVKYKDGENGYDTPQDYIDADLSMTPVAMSYEAQIVVTIKNISSVYGISAALHGFVGSAFMASRTPSDFQVVHHFNLNNHQVLNAGEDIGTRETPWFVTFGPPLSAPDSHKYEVYLKITIVNGENFEDAEGPYYDVTDQVLPVIETIKDNLSGTKPIEHGIKVPIELSITLPIVDPVEGSIGLDEWGDDEIITVPIS